MHPFKVDAVPLGINCFCGYCLIMLFQDLQVRLSVFLIFRLYYQTLDRQGIQDANDISLNSAIHFLYFLMNGIVRIIVAFSIDFHHSLGFIHKTIPIISCFKYPYANRITAMIYCFQLIIYFADFFWHICFQAVHVKFIFMLLKLWSFITPTQQQQRGAGNVVNDVNWLFQFIFVVTDGCC